MRQITAKKSIDSTSRNITASLFYLNRIICRFSFVLVACLLMPVQLQADEIDADQALEIASRFASTDATVRQMVSSSQSATQSRKQSLQKSLTPKLAYSELSTLSGKAGVYVVNLGSDCGFVIVAGDDRADAEILGWCDHGSFEYDKAPVQLKKLIKNYSAEIDSLRENPAVNSTVRQAANLPFATNRRVAARSDQIGQVVVGPLLKTTWGQFGPYNGLCPEGCPAGCYPVAVAQIMNYWKWPAESRGTVDGEDFSGHVYDWGNMLDSYDNGYNGDQAYAVAKLLADVGTAFHTIYTSEASATYANIEPLIENFGYEPNRSLLRASAASLLTESFKTELDANRPILYSGGDSINRHALVCDGYTTSGYFHFNYGWGGQCDGYYRNAACDFFWSNCGAYVEIKPYEVQEEVIDGIKYGLLKNGTAEVNKWTYAVENFTNPFTTPEVPSLDIPSTVRGSDGNEYKVTRIRKGVFSRNCHIGRVTLGDNIEIIEPNAFGNTHIDTLILSDMMEEVPAESFQATDVKCLTIGAGVKRIGNKAFYTCPLRTVTSRSSSFEVGDDAFYWSTPDCGEWLDCITSLGERAFGAATFRNEPHFANLESIGSRTFAGVTFPSSDFKIPGKLKHIEPDAFKGTQVYSFSVDEENPWYSALNGILYNKSLTSLVLTPVPNMTLGDDAMPFPSGLACMERGSVTSRKTRWDTYSIVIPSTVEDVTDAFCNCDAISNLTVLAVEPPLATDESFNDALFNDEYRTLYVPEGCEELYYNAPGWRRFPRIIGDQPYKQPAEDGREYYMVLHKDRNVRVPVGDVSMMYVETGDSSRFVISKTDGTSLNILVENVDSVTWMKGFLRDKAQLFNLDPEHLTADSKLCSVTFGATTIDDDVQLAIRNAVTTLKVVDEVTKSVGFDLSLSNDVHQLKGAAKITVPFVPNDGERVGAAYFNEETGLWDRVFFTYDSVQQAAVIVTNHLSMFSVFSIKEKAQNSRLDMVYPEYWAYTPLNTFNEATKVLFDIMQSDDPDVEAVMKWKEDMGFWQSVGIDGGYNMLSSLGFMPDVVNNAVEIVGNIGTAMSILDVIAADLKGDDIGVASNTLKSILSLATGQMSSAIGTGIMSASMGMTAFIGVALEKFGTMVAKAKLDYGRAMYRYYYSKEGAAECAPQSEFGSSYYRDVTDWYDLFYPAFQKPMTELQLRSYIEQVVRRYCDQFWEENGTVQTYCQQEAGRLGFTSFHGIGQTDRQTISDEYFAELMNGELVSVFQNIRNNIQAQCDARLEKALADFQTQMNTKVAFKFVDSSCKEGEVSKYNGWTIRFTEMPDVADTEHWGCTVGENGLCGLGYFTQYSLISRKVANSLTLYNPDGEEYAVYSYQIPDGTGTLIIEIDLATGGTVIDAPRIDNLKLEYDPATISSSYTMYGSYNGGQESYSTTAKTFIAMDGSFNRNARFQKGLEKFFKQHDYITVDASGHILIGDDIVGEFPGNGLEGSGTFTISSSEDFQEKTVESYIDGWQKYTDDSDVGYLFVNLLDGTIKYDLECKFDITRTEDGGEYSIVYTGTGTFELDAKVIDTVDGVGYDTWPSATTFTPEDITTRSLHQSGTVTLSYPKRIGAKYE